MERMVLCVAALLVAGAGCEKTASFPLAGARVVVADAFMAKPVSGWGLAAARDLTNALCRVTGRPSPLLRESEAGASDSPTIWLGPTHAAERAGVALKDVTRDQAHVVVKGNDAFIAAPGELGASNGAVEFLQRFADYWFVTIDGNDPVVRNPAARATACDFVLRPTFSWRHISLGGERKYAETTGALLQKDYARRLRVQTWKVANQELDKKYVPSVSRYGHSFYRYLPPEKYFRDHPDWYTLGKDGTRHATANNDSQLCLSNPEVLEQVTTNLFAFIDADRAKFGEDHPVIYDFAQMDNSAYYCMCPACQKTVARYNRVKGGNKEGGDAGLLLEFVNELARRARAKYGDVVIRTFAYVSTDMPPPEGFKLEDNVLIWFCDLYSVSDHDLPLAHPFNAPRRAVEEGWHRLAKQLQLWDYWLYSAAYPEIFVDAVAADLRYHRSMGVERMFCESFFDRQCFYELNTFVTAQCLVDADADPDRLVDVYCRVYGGASAEMRAAIDFLRKLTLENPPADAASWHARALPWLTVPNFIRLCELVERAWPKADTPAAKSRVAAVLAATARAILARTRGIAAWKAERARATTDFTRWAELELAAAPLAAKDVEIVRKGNRAFVETLNLKFRDLPPDVVGADENDLLVYDWHSVYASRKSAVLEDDPDSEIGKAYRRLPQRNENEPPFNTVFIDEVRREAVRKQLTPPADGKYHWYRIGYGRMGRTTRFVVTYENYIGFPNLSGSYIECDGMATDPNWYDVYVSVKYNGPARAGDPKTGLSVDRLLLRRRPKAVK